ncbi:TPA: inorganic pyrophosphatase [Candidatus Woesearchaeota archaeon]|nr:inorganic pyrophosphatase [Candidatus Woesearchaeota archaeon]
MDKIDKTEKVKSTSFLGKIIAITIDRPLHSKHPKYDWLYELNYGFVQNTIADDGEELDAYIIGIDKPLEEFIGKCIAIIHRTNDNDDKLVIVPNGMNLTDEEIKSATLFQEQFFKSEIIRKI